MRPEDARAVVTSALGGDPGPLTFASSDSHHVYVGTDAVVKLLDADAHVRMRREIALAPVLPTALTAPLLASGEHQLGTRTVRYAVYARVPGTAPGMGLPGVDGPTARSLAEQAVERLDVLHRWSPPGEALAVLQESLDHGGFAGRSALLAEIEALAGLGPAVAPDLLDGLAAIADRAPSRAQSVVPVHADCHWGNWLADDGRLTALLDFEWARLGEPVDDWFFLARFSGPRQQTVLDVVAAATATPVDALRADCEAREAAYLVFDLRLGLEGESRAQGLLAVRLRELEELVLGRRWWR